MHVETHALLDSCYGIILLEDAIAKELRCIPVKFYGNIQPTILIGVDNFKRMIPLRILKINQQTSVQEWAGPFSVDQKNTP